MRYVRAKTPTAGALLAIVVVGVSLVACGEKKDAAAGKSPDTAAAAAPAVPLAPAEPLAFNVVESTMGWGELGVGRSIKGTPLTVAGKAHASGLGMHAPAKVRISFPATFKTFSGSCGIDDEEQGRGSVAFKVLDGEKVLFSSPVVHGSSPALDFSVSVEGLSGLTLVVEDGGDGMVSDHGDWLDLKLK